MRCPRVRSLDMGFSSLVLLFFLLVFHFFFMMDFVGLTMILLFDCFVDKRHVAPSLNFVNVADLNRVLKFEVFVSEDRQLRMVHLILYFEPLSDNSRT